MNAIKLLTEQHRQMESLFAEVAKTKAGSRRKELFKDLAFLLLDHMESEEVAFYPAIASRDIDDVREGTEEHHVMRPLIQNLSLMEPEDELYLTKVGVLGELNEHHVREEEKDLFPKYRKVFSEDELEDLGQKVQAVQSTLQASRA